MTRALAAILTLGLVAAAAPGQDAGGRRLESLDELLGLAPPGSPTDDTVRMLPDPLRAELERALSEEEAAQAFEQAAALMDQTASRLTEMGDTGLATQRLQEDIIRKLDAVIAAAQQNQQQQQQNQQQQQQQQQPSQPQQQQQQSQTAQGENVEERDPPSGRDGPLRPEIESARAAWGALPQRVRDSLMQGLSDRYSSLYERLTESYYRRLAEEGAE